MASPGKDAYRCPGGVISGQGTARANHVSDDSHTKI